VRPRFPRMLASFEGFGYPRSWTDEVSQLWKRGDGSTGGVSSLSHAAR
jgi:hypothetical protein